MLHGVNLVIEAGQTVALVGPTGAGKTSIASLVARFYDVSGGALLIDGIDVREVAQQLTARADGPGAAGAVPFPRQRCRQHPLWLPGAPATRR